MKRFFRFLSFSLPFIIAFFIAFFAMTEKVIAQEASKTLNLNPIQISGLGAFTGKYLTVYYAVGSRGSLHNEEDQITVRELKAKRSFQISDDSISIPEINLPKANIFITYNILVFVIHDGEQFTWVNGNKTLPEGEVPTGRMQNISVDSLTKIEFDLLKSRQAATMGSVIQYHFGLGVPADPM